MSERLQSTIYDAQKSIEIPQSLKTINLFNLTAQEEEILKQRVHESQGLVDILVHPYFREDDSHSKRGPSDAYRENRNKSIQQSVLANTTPLVIFEERQELDLLADKIGTEEGTMYIVATHSEKPTPWINQEEVNNENLAWEKLSAVFENIGVKHLNVGGRYLYFAGFEDSEGIVDMDTVRDFEHLKQFAKDKPHALSWINQGFFPFGCAGTAAQQLIRKGFDVSLSSISSPDSYPLQ